MAKKDYGIASKAVGRKPVQMRRHLNDDGGGDQGGKYNFKGSGIQGDEYSNRGGNRRMGASHSNAPEDDAQHGRRGGPRPGTPKPPTRPAKPKGQVVKKK